MLDRSLQGLSSLFITASLALLTSSRTQAQQLIEVGTVDGANGFQTYPAPYGNQNEGARHQVLFLASELNAAGMVEGNISALAFDVFAMAGNPLLGFSINIGTTTATTMGPVWLNGLTNVWGPVDYTDTDGWNTHTFDTPFLWDGVSNLVVETCFSNGFTTFNSQMNYGITIYNSVLYRQSTQANVCTANMGGTLVPTPLRPHVRFSWSPLVGPPVAAFAPSATFSCSGVIQFTDLSQFEPTGWTWDFGDGDTSTLQNPEHTYLTDGTFTVTLIDTNAYGADTTTLDVTVSATSTQPIPACTPASPGTIAGFGITEVSFGDVSVSSADALTEGYADRGCINDTVLVGGIFDLDVITGQVTTHNVRAWVDWNNDGTFGATELVLTANSVLAATTSVTVPNGAVLDTPLRMRVMADYDFSAAPQPCVDPQFGQAEDYALVVIENPFPPEAHFSAVPLISCDGSIQFTDESLNTPTGWDWDFGDSGSSTDENPVHVYTASGVYTVELIVINANGSDTLVLTDLITIDLNGALIPAACTPGTQSYCCGYGILAFDFAGISSTSVDGSEGYQDRSCGNTATLEEGSTYPWSVTTGDQNAHDTRMWIDLNNDGAFSNGELVQTSLDEISPTANVLIPSGSVYNTPLRLRLQSDVVGQSSDACDLPLYGQTEDFSAIIVPNPDPPTADFSASPETTCDGIVQFTDLSTDLPTSWDWDFGDGNGSTLQNPQHTYGGVGSYTVSLTATNGNGSDTQTYIDLIEFVPPTVCDTVEMPNFGADLRTECQGVMTDDGGPNNNYSPGESGSITIAPTNAGYVTLTFSQFEFEDGGPDYLRIYDGIDILAPLIGEFTGSGIGVLPNGGVITSTGPSITVQQAATPGMITWEGFVATWDCSLVGVEEPTNDPIGNIWPQPARNELNISFSAGLHGDLDLVLFNALGSAVVTQHVAHGTGQLALDVSSLAPGCYMLAATTEQGRFSRAIVLQ